MVDKTSVKITPPQSPPGLEEDAFESSTGTDAFDLSTKSAPAISIGSLFTSTKAVSTLPMKASPRASTLRPSADKLSIKVSTPRDSLRSSEKTSPKDSPKSTPVSPAAAIKVQKWQDAQSVEWKPKRTRRGSAPRALSHRSKSPSPRTPVSQPSPKPIGIACVGFSEVDLLSKFARGTNGPARPAGSDPREGRGKYLNRQGSPEASETDDLDAKFGRGSRAPSAASTGRFSFASRRNSKNPRPSVSRNKDRPNPLFERTAVRDKAMRRNTWRSSSKPDPKADQD